MTQTRLGEVLEGYLFDLDRVCAAALAADEDGDQGAEPALMAKLVLESVRLAVYEQTVVLPLLARAGIGEERDGDSDGEEARLERLVGTASSLAEGEPEGNLAALARAVADVTGHQREHLRPALDHLPDEVQQEAAERLTPTTADGATHSHPSELARFESLGWPRPGYVQAAREAFAAETAPRVGG